MQVDPQEVLQEAANQFTPLLARVLILAGENAALKKRIAELEQAMRTAKPE